MEKKTTSRRGLLKLGIAAAGGAALAPGAILAQTRSEQSSAAVVTARRFRGWVSRGAGEGRTTFQELTLRPISGRQVVVRTEASNLCYSNVGAVLVVALGCEQVIAETLVEAARAA